MKNNKKGFTLVELVIVVAVMAVLVAVAIPTVSSITQTAKNTVADTNARTIESVIKLAEAEASKNGNGTATLGEGDIATAIVNAKLGINEGSFYYNAKTGSVSRTTSEGAITITFSATQVTVGTTAKDLAPATPAPSTPAGG